MNLGLVTIAALFFLLPGVAFIVGVNVADKNVREIVFRNTPAEIGYVVFISVIVHLLFSAIPGFNATTLFSDYKCMSHAAGSAGCDVDPRGQLAVSLLYVLAASFIGFLPGLGLGLSIRWQVHPLTNAFVKHRWMLDLITRDPGLLTYARVVHKDVFKLNAGAEDRPLIVKGAIRDIFFSADGTLLYLVLHSFQDEADTTSPGARVALLPQLDSVGSRMPSTFFIEGKNVAFAAFYKQKLQLDQTERHLEAAGMPAVIPGEGGA